MIINDTCKWNAELPNEAASFPNIPPTAHEIGAEKPLSTAFPAPRIARSGPEARLNWRDDAVERRGRRMPHRFRPEWEIEYM
jgi:hypothetical protein